MEEKKKSLPNSGKTSRNEPNNKTNTHSDTN